VKKSGFYRCFWAMEFHLLHIIFASDYLVGADAGRDETYRGPTPPNALDRSASAHLVQQTRGHSSLAVTSVYAHAGPSHSSTRHLAV